MLKYLKTKFGGVKYAARSSYKSEKRSLVFKEMLEFLLQLKLTVI